MQDQLTKVEVETITGSSYQVIKVEKVKEYFGEGDE